MATGMTRAGGSRLLSASLLAAAVAALLFGAGCNLLLGLDPLEKVAGAGGAGASGSGGSGADGGGGTGGAGTGGGPGCDPGECDAMDTDCINFGCNAALTACDGGEALPAGVPCDAGEGPSSGACNGQGVCLLMACTNGVKDGNETDVDCGGDCAVVVSGKCDAFDTCVVNSDCKGNTCTNGICGPCFVTSDCEAGDYCNQSAGICESAKDNGAPCGSNGGSAECINGHCVDGFCCDTGCTAACESCQGASTGAPDGVCAPVAAGTDPDGECTPNGCQGSTCGGQSGACAPAPSGTVCRPSSGVCDVAETCNGVTVTCPTNQFQPNTTECRIKVGSCDVAENCSGTSPNCPADSFAPDGVQGSPSCTPYLCNGTMASCPTTCVGGMDCAAGFSCTGANICQ